MPRMPAIFFGHGNPMNAVPRNSYTDRWTALHVLARKFTTASKTAAPAFPYKELRKLSKSDLSLIDRRLNLFVTSRASPR